MPVAAQDEIIFHPYPLDHSIDCEELSKIISYRSNAHFGDNPIPRGDQSDSPHQQPDYEGTRRESDF